MTSFLDDSQQQILNVMRKIGEIEDRNENSIQVIRSFLTKTKLFKSIADTTDYPYILKETSLILKYQKYRYGEFLFHQGELGENLYFVLGGQGSVYLPKEDYELKSDLIYYQKIGQTDSESSKSQDKEEKIGAKSQMEPQKNLTQSRNSCELTIQDFKNELSNNLIDKNQKKVFLENENNMTNNRTKIQLEEDDEVSILALNEKHYPRYFRISRDFAMYKRVRFERYLDHFGELAAEEQFNRRLASVVASSKDQDFEVAYISLQDFKAIFSTVIENLYLVQNTLCEQLINTSKKQTINFSYLFSETIKLERGQTIFVEGTPVNGVYIVRKGTISIKKAITDQKSPIKLAILSQKDLFGHEDAFTNYMTRTISAVSEAYGTEVQFAKIDDILAFIQNHKEFEKELKRKSELKINFYQKRVANIENLFKSNKKFQYQIDKKINKIPLDGDDQNDIFNKFLQNSREQIVSQEANATIRSSQNIIQVSKLLKRSGTQIMEKGNILKSRQLKSPQIESKQPPKQQTIEIQQQIKKQQNEGNQIQEQQRMQVFKGRNNLRTKSLINIRPQVSLDQNNNMASQLILGKNNKQEIQDTSIERAESQAEQKKQNFLQTTKQPSSKIKRQATFSQYSSNKQTQQNLDNLEEAKPSVKVDINLFNDKDQQDYKSVYQNKKISKKLKEAIAGQWNVKPENWTIDSIEKQIKINSQNLTSNKNQISQPHSYSIVNDSKNLKLIYLHNDMDSFEYAKKFVILKRQHKKTQYLHQSQTNLSNLNTVEGYKKQQQTKEQKVKSPISSPQNRFDDKLKQIESTTEDHFFNPHIQIQKFSRYLLNNQQNIKSIDVLPNSNDLRSSKKIATLGRLSLNEINSPMARSFISSQNISKPSTSQSKCKTNDINKESLMGGEKEKQKIVKLRQCSSAIIDYNFDQDISEDFNEELQTSFIRQNKQANQKEIFNVQKLQEESLKQEEKNGCQIEMNQKINENKLNSSDKIQKQVVSFNKQRFIPRLQFQNPQKRFSQQFDEKTRIPLIQFNAIQNNKENQALNSKDQNIENLDKNNKLLSHHKGFLLNICQSPISKNQDSPKNLQKIFEEQATEKKQENQQQQHKTTESCPNRSRVLSHHAFCSEIDLENNHNSINENEIKYFLNANYVKMNESFSPIIIQKLQSQKQTNTSSHFSKHQISFVQPSTTFIDRCVSSHDSPIYQTNNFLKPKQINFGYSQNSNIQQQLSKNNQQLLSRNIKSQIGAFRSSNKFFLQQQQHSQTKANNTNNFQMQVQSLQKQWLLSQNINSIKANLNSLVLKQCPMNMQISDSKFYQIEGIDDLVSPIHHSSLSPNLRKTNIERIQSSSKQGRSSLSNQISSFNQQIEKRDSFSPSSNKNNSIQNDQFMKRFSVDTFNTPKDDSKYANIKFTVTNDQSFNSHNTYNNTPKDILQSKSTSKTLQGFSKQSKIQSNSKSLKKSLFNKEDQPKNNILSNAFPNKNKAANHSKQKSYESIREGISTPSQTLLSIKKKQNVHVTDKFNQNQYACLNTDIPQPQLLTIIPYQPFTNFPSAYNQTLTKFNSHCINQITKIQNN
ncbi:hypothetical protein ABPG72_000553 [Tetrahymena utriculariae]